MVQSRGYGWTTAGLVQPPFPRGGRCTVCGEGFASDSAATRHRHGDGMQRTCYTPEEMVERGMHLTDSGLWALASRGGGWPARHGEDEAAPDV